MPEVEWISRGAERVIKDFDNVVKAKERDVNATKGSARANEELGRIVAKISKDGETAWDRYTRRVVDAKRAHDFNKLSVQGMSREMTNATVALLRETDATDRNTAAQNRAAAARRQHQRLMSGIRLETLRGVSAIQAETASIQSMTMQLGNFANKAHGVGASLGALGRLGPLAPAVFAGAVMSRASQDRAELGAAGDRAIASSVSAGRLMELAGGDKAAAAKLLGASRASYLEGGFATEGESHGLTFALESGGMLGDRQFFSRMAQGGYNAQGAAENISMIRSAFAGGDPTGSPSQIYSKALAAAKFAPKADAADIMSGVVKAAPSAKSLGLSDEETFAAVALGANVTKSGEESGTLMGSLFRAWTSAGLADKGPRSLQDLMADTQGRRLAKSELQKFLGRDEAQRAFDALADTRAVTTQIEAMRSAERSNTADTVVGQAIGLPARKTAVAVNRRRAETQLMEEEAGLRRLRVQAQYEAELAQNRDEMGSLFGAIGNVGLSMFNALPVSDALRDPGTTQGVSMDQVAASLEVGNAQREQANAQREQQLKNQNRFIMRRPQGRRE